MFSRIARAAALDPLALTTLPRVIVGTESESETEGEGCAKDNQGPRKAEGCVKEAHSVHPYEQAGQQKTGEVHR